MEWNTIFDLITPELLIVVAVCWVLGLSIKKIPQVPDWSIVFILTIFAIGAVIGLFGLSVQSMLQGILCGAFSVYGNQLVRQGIEAVNEDKRS